MAKSAFWRDLASQFLALQQERKINARSDEYMHSAFEALAKQGASEIANTERSDLFAAWFEALTKEKLDLYRPIQPENTTSVDEFSLSLAGNAFDTMCEASATLCKRLEVKATDTEFEEKRLNDPRNWSPLRQRQAAVDKIEELRAAPPKEIKESFVRNVLAEQYGIKPEEVSPKQIAFEVSGLLRDHPTIFVPLQQIPESTSAPEPSSEPQPQSPEEQPKGATPEPPAAKEKPRKRLSVTIHCPAAARKLETFLEEHGIGLTEFATKVGTTDRTLRSFRRTGKIKRDIFEEIAKAMGMTKESLLKTD